LPTSLVSLSVLDFLAKLASSEPAPGGGSASALAVAAAAALVEMVARLTVDREQFAAVKADMDAVLSAAPDLHRRAVAFVDKDTEAFEAVMRALRLPKATPEEKTERRRAVETATKGAAEVPLRVAAIAADVLSLARIVAEKGNPSAVTDAGVAGRLALAGAEGAALNVRINLGGIQDMEFCGRVTEELDGTLERVRRHAAAVDAAVQRRLGLNS